jgi:hypothetical protein
VKKTHSVPKGLDKQKNSFARTNYCSFLNNPVLRDAQYNYESAIICAFIDFQSACCLRVHCELHLRGNTRRAAADGTYGDAERARGVFGRGARRRTAQHRSFLPAYFINRPG